MNAAFEHDEPRNVWLWKNKLSVPCGWLVLLPGRLASGRKFPIDAVAVDFALRAGLYESLPKTHMQVLLDSRECTLFGAPATPAVEADLAAYGDKGDDPPLHARQVIAKYAEGACALLTSAIPVDVVGRWDVSISEDEALWLTPRLDDEDGDCWCEVDRLSALEALGGFCPCRCHEETSI